MPKVFKIDDYKNTISDIVCQDCKNNDWKAYFCADPLSLILVCDVCESCYEYDVG